MFYYAMSNYVIIYYILFYSIPFRSVLLYLILFWLTSCHTVYRKRLGSTADTFSDRIEDTAKLTGDAEMSFYSRCRCVPGDGIRQLSSIEKKECKTGIAEQCSVMLNSAAKCSASQCRVVNRVQQCVGLVERSHPTPCHARDAEMLRDASYRAVQCVLPDSSPVQRANYPESFLRTCSTDRVGSLYV